jgi:DNA adenine methylase
MANSESFELFNLNLRARPILKWAGGKSQLLPQLLPHFPRQFNRYIEPFLGAGSIYFSLHPKCPAIINDANPELYELYLVLRDHPGELAKILDSYAKKYSEDFYYELRARKPTTPLNRAARFIFLNKTGFNGLYRLNSRGQFNVPFGKRKKCPTLYEAENLKHVAERLKRSQIKNVDFEKILRLAKKGDFVYCDPPYSPLSRTSCFNSYIAGGFSHEEQVRLKIACDKAVDRGAIVAISNSSAPLILDLYKDWKVHFIRARRSINSKAARRGPIHEVLGLPC